MALAVFLVFVGMARLAYERCSRNSRPSNHPAPFMKPVTFGLVTSLSGSRFGGGTAPTR